VLFRSQQDIESATDTFDVLLELMQAVRQNPAWEASVDEATLLREAHMRRAIRRATKQHANPAVICGAFHAPVLAELPPAKEDNARLKGLKKTQSAITWIPWTYERLALRSGYGAGVVSPAWYDLIFAVPEARRISTWMTQAARLFRREGLDASPAHAIEAGRLAHALAALRGQAQPRLAEMLEAVQTVMARGETAPLRLVEAELVVGQQMGTVPEGTPELPLQKHVRAEQKRLRLKPKHGLVEASLDLRKDFHREKSYLLHRLGLLGVNWGKMRDVSGALGTFREEWQLRWQPECELALIEAAFWGNTLEKACTNRIRRSIKEKKELPVLTELLERAFLAGLDGAIPSLVKRLHRLAATDRDPDHLLQALPSLAHVLRYGDVRALPATQVRPVVDSLAPRLMLGLPAACRQLDEAFAQQRWEQLLRVHQAMQLLGSRAAETGEKDHGPAWHDTLATLADSPGVHPLLAGGCLRLLYERGQRDAGQVAQAMARILSPGTPEDAAAAWVEGFLHGSGTLLIHQPQLWQLLDAWVSELPEERFQAALPLLRRTFSRFAAPERRRMGEQAQHGLPSAQPETDEAARDPERAALVEAVLNQLLGPPAEDSTR
jgi:hypothetical protein